MTKHLLVTNDFPPKVGGIQSYLWELWRRLPPDEVTVLTSPHKGASAFDADQAFRVVRTREPWLLPHRWLRRRMVRMPATTFSAISTVFETIETVAARLRARASSLRPRFSVC